MIVMETDRLVDDYLRRLEAAAAHLQRSRRAELVAEIREHIEAALRQEDTANEVAVRNVLERLGPPEEIVEAAEPPPSESPARAGKLEIAALIALVVPFLGWILGAVLVVASRAWSGKEKAVGITLATGSETISGSTRLKAGTSQKIALNTLSKICCFTSSMLFAAST